jgi:hypothetical protein
VATAKDVEVEVGDGFSGVGSVVDHHAVAGIFDSAEPSDLLSGEE